MVPERAGEENMAHAKGEKERSRSFSYERNVFFLEESSQNGSSQLVLSMIRRM